MRVLKIMLLGVWAMGLSLGLAAQGGIPDADFEQWSNGTGGQFQEPSSDWWTSLNALRGLGAPVTVEKTTDAHSGTYAARLESAEWSTILLPGLLVSGNFDALAPSFLVTGQPFVDRPTTFSGWFKYYPVNGDSGGVAALFTRWDAGTQRRDTVGIAAQVLYDTVGTWTQYVMPVVYASALLPDTLILALVSSKGGDQFLGQAGSTLYADDLAFDYTVGMDASEELLVGMGPHPVRDVLHVRLGRAGRTDVRLYDLFGRALGNWVVQGRMGELDLSGYGAGSYVVELRNGGKVVRERVVVVGR